MSLATDTATLATWIIEDAHRALQAAREGETDTLVSCLEAILIAARGLGAGDPQEDTP